MVSIDQVFKLLEMGFTKDEIFRLIETAQEETKPSTEPEPVPAAQEPAAETVPAPAENQEPSETEKRLDSIENSINGLMKAIQAQNLKNDSFGQNPDSLEDVTDKIMASIIRPEPAKGSEKR